MNLPEGRAWRVPSFVPIVWDLWHRDSDWWRSRISLCAVDDVWTTFAFVWFSETVVAVTTIHHLLLLRYLRHSHCRSFLNCRTPSLPSTINRLHYPTYLSISKCQNVNFNWLESEFLVDGHFGGLISTIPQMKSSQQRKYFLVSCRVPWMIVRAMVAEQKPPRSKNQCFFNLLMHFSNPTRHLILTVSCPHPK